MELRAVWSQESSEKFNLVARLIEGRITYLRNVAAPIMYAAPTQTEFNGVELRTRFYIYIEEAGLKYEDFKDLLPKDVQRGHFDDFINPSISAKERLKRAEKYWDLLPASEWVRKTLIEILADPKVYGTELYNQYITRLQELSDKQASLNHTTPVIPPRSEVLKKLWSSFRKIISPPKPIETKPLDTSFRSLIFLEMLQSIETRFAEKEPKRPSSPKTAPPNLSAFSCEGVFL